MDHKPTPEIEEGTGNGPFSFIFVGVVLALFVADLLASNKALGMASLLFVPAWAILTVIHEAAHALSAHLLGWRVPTLEVGFGKLWRQLRVGQTDVLIRQYPIVGSVHIVPTHFRQPRLRNALIYAAGPLSEGVIVLVLLSSFGYQSLVQPEGFWSASAAVVAIAALISVVMNLFPYRLANGGMTDGLGIVSSPWLSQSHFEHLYCAPIVDQLVNMRSSDTLTTVLNHLTELSLRFPNVILIRYELCCTLVLLGRRSEALFNFQAYVSGLDESHREQAQVHFDRLRIYPNSQEAAFPWHEH